MDKASAFTNRLISIHALRGPDLFFMAGFAGIYQALRELSDYHFFNCYPTIV